MKLFLFILFCFCGLPTYMVEGVGSEVMKKSFCVSWNQPLKSNKVKTYTIEEGAMRAVIFTTHNGFKVCADPKANWVKKVISSVDRRITERRNKKSHDLTATC